MSEIERKRMFKEAFALLDRANELLDFVHDECAEKLSPDERKAA